MGLKSASSDSSVVQSSSSSVTCSSKVSGQMGLSTSISSAVRGGEVGAIVLAVAGLSSGLRTVRVGPCMKSEKEFLDVRLCSDIGLGDSERGAWAKNLFLMFFGSVLADVGDTRSPGCWALKGDSEDAKGSAHGWTKRTVKVFTFSAEVRASFVEAREAFVDARVIFVEARESFFVEVRVSLEKNFAILPIAVVVEALKDDFGACLINLQPVQVVV